MNYQDLVSVLSASADNTDLGFDNSWYHAQPHPIIICCRRVTLTFDLVRYSVKSKVFYLFIKHVLDEVEHDIMNYQNQGLCYLLKPKADNTDRRFFYDIMQKPNSIIVLLYIFHIIHPQKHKESVQPFCFWGEHSKGLSNQADLELDMINAISAADIAFIVSSSQAIVNWLNALDQSDFFIVSLMYNNVYYRELLSIIFMYVLWINFLCGLNFIFLSSWIL